MERVRNIIKEIYGRYYTIVHSPWKKFKSIGVFVRFNRRYISLIGAKYISVGNNVHILPNVRIEMITSYGKDYFKPSLEIKDNVVINQNLHCTCASHIHIGEGTAITANCGIFDIIHPYDDISASPKDQPIIVKPVMIGKHCLIGMNTVIQPGVTLGDHVIVGANSVVVSGQYPSYSVLAGSPAKIIKQYNSKTNKWEKSL